MESAWNVGVWGCGGTNRERFSERKMGSEKLWIRLGLYGPLWASENGFLAWESPLCPSTSMPHLS